MTTPRALPFWRSLGELEDDEDFRRFLDAEFPSEATVASDPLSRREMLRLMGASLALAGLGACTRAPGETIVPYVNAPEDFVPGRPLFFASAMSLGGFGLGVLVESQMGRPTKVEGNTLHPASLGATNPFAQAAVLTLYDPDRSPAVTHLGRISSWDGAVAALKDQVSAQRLKGGAGLRILTERVTSPTLAAQIKMILAAFPQAKWHQYEPITHANSHDGARLAFGADVATRYRLDDADVVVSLEADFLGAGPSHVRDARRFATRRNPHGDRGMNRLYVLESSPSVTGTMADHRQRILSRDISPAALALARAISAPPNRQAPSDVLAGLDAFLSAAAYDLLQHRGTSLVIAGEQQPPVVHALAHFMNDRLGNVGRTVEYSDPIEAAPVDDMQSLRELIADMDRGSVELLVIVGANPAFTAPRDQPFADRLSRVKFALHLGLYADETAALCHWHIPQAHDLEAWSDVRAFDGTVTIVQPLIAPLYDGKSAHELLSVILDGTERSGYDQVREFWRAQRLEGAFEERWTKALSDGVVDGTALSSRTVSLSASLDDLASIASRNQLQGVEIVFHADPTIWDGRFANNGWLQELPKPVTKLTWDAAASISPATARRLGCETGDVVRLSYRDAAIETPVWILPGQADESVSVTMGYGRRRGGRIATGLGFDAYALRTSDAPWIGGSVTITKTGRRYELVSTQQHFSMEGRDLVRVLNRDRLDQANASENPEPSASLYPDYQYPGHAWGMAIDLNACIGCGACTIACQAENNIPVVGKREVSRGREMHWIRVDRYFAGEPDEPAIYHQPVPCMHCENAPCELVCPVGATVHSEDGLNQMVYNRCVGTRYCSNNCPYKVRRFNFFQYADWTTPSLKGLRNPDVSVRSRGVMEKCTYCVQRINAAKIDAEKDDRAIRDGEIVTACQAVCPSQAIVFGDLNDRGSRVAALRADPRNYGLLTELNTRPRTTYLSRVRNPSERLEGRTADGT